MAQRFIFMGSPPLAATILGSLVEAGYIPELVVTQPPRPSGRGQEEHPTAVQIKAEELNLKFIVTANVNSDETLAALSAVQPDLILVAAFGQIFKKPLLSLPKKYSLNVHTSLLPKYRGAAPVHWAIMNGDEETGVSIQKMVSRLDAGDILLQKKMRIPDDATSEEVLEKLAVLGGDSLIESLKLIEAGKEKFVAQDESKVTFAPKIEKKHALISWGHSALQIYNQIRSLQPWPIAETRLGKDRLKIFKAIYLPSKEMPFTKTPGGLETDHKSFLKVYCGDGGVLSLTEIQLENRKKLSISDFLKGYRGLFPFVSFAGDHHEP
jgi:methionyl-tRNA formyltransferase